MWHFQNPVEIISGDNALSELHSRINGRNYSIVTYDNDVFKTYTEEVIQAIGHQPNHIIDGVVENPHFDNLSLLCEQLAKQREYRRFCRSWWRFSHGHRKGIGRQQW